MKKVSVPDTKISSRITYLARHSPPGHGTVLPPGVEFVQASGMSAATYLELFREVGEPWLWWSRLTFSESQLQALLDAPTTELYLCRVAGEVAGFAELDRGDATAPRICYLGLKPGFVGRGLGDLLIGHCLEKAWVPPVERVELDTCDFDHPAVLAFYQRHGFRIVREETEVWDDPRLIGLMPMSAAPHRPPAHTNRDD